MMRNGTQQSHLLIQFGLESCVNRIILAKISWTTWFKKRIGPPSTWAKQILINFLAISDPLLDGKQESRDEISKEEKTVAKLCQAQVKLGYLSYIYTIPVAWVQHRVLWLGTILFTKISNLIFIPFEEKNWGCHPFRNLRLSSI